MDHNKISIGDLTWDDINKIFGLVTEKVNERSWVVSWNDGKKNWVYDDTVLLWKKLPES